LISTPSQLLGRPLAENPTAILYIKNINMRIRRFFATLTVLFLLIFTPRAATGAPPPQSKRSPSDAEITAIGKRTIVKSPYPMSLYGQITSGKQFAQGIERTARILDDPMVTEFLNRLHEKLTQNSDAKVPFTVRVIDSEFPDAFVLSGGYLYVHSGLILQMESEGELAGVLAHAIAHVVLGAPAQWPFWVDFSNGPAAVILPGGWAGWGIYDGLADGVSRSLLKYQRDQEFDADYFGLQYLYKAGYDPDCFVRFIDRTGQTPTVRKKTSGYLRPNTPSSDRVKAMKKEIAEILPPRDESIITSADFEVFKDRVRYLQLAQPELRKLKLKDDPDFETPPFLKRHPRGLP
jgi:predicted Zn-dependent protease